jgi:outer membrane receptor protein involved in Fe transport
MSEPVKNETGNPFCRRNSMTFNRDIAFAVRRALIFSAVAAGATLPIQAQDQQDAGEQTVTVTGSRITIPNQESISPVTAITTEELRTSGKTRIEDVLNQLPQAFAAQGSSVSNASDGTATVDLRHLGEERTLVLVNGRRLMPGDPDGGNAADLNQIPLALVKRIDVLTGGASATYGADAVAGVVNFIMDTEFEGIRFDANYSFYNHRNDNMAGGIVDARGFQNSPRSINAGYAKDFTFAMGIGGDKGHATVYAGYREVDAVLQSMYDYSACTFNSGNSFTCGGSGTSDPAHFTILNPDGSGKLISSPSCPQGSGCIVGANGALRPFTAAQDAYNFGPLNYYQRPDERYTAGLFANFNVTDNIEAYGEVMYMDDRSVAQIAPSGAFNVAANISCQNPFLTADQRTQFCDSIGIDSSDPTSRTTVLVARRNTEGGGRQNDLGHVAFRSVTGLRGDMFADWKYDVSFQHGQTQRNSTYYNDFSISRSAQALDAVDQGLVQTGTANGNIVCGINADADANNDNPSCAPYNIWTPGGVTPAALAFLQTPGFIRAQHTQRIAHADFTGDVSKFVTLPTAGSGLLMNFGFEYRTEEVSFNPDIAYQTGDLAGQGGATPPVQGDYYVKEAFVEARLPLIEDRPFINSLNLETAYRYSDYSIDFSTDTYKFGLDWAPVDPLRVRASYQRAVRVPNLGELYLPATIALSGTNDPCDGTPTATLEQCMRSGVTPAQYGNIPQNPASQYNGLIGGNPTTKPETADTTSFGFIFQPDFVPNLFVAIDYFDIKIEDYINPTVGGLADVTLTQCLNTGDPTFCSRIQRDGAGSLWLNSTDSFIVDLALNTGSLSTSGIDLQTTYSLPVGDYRLGFSLVGTYLDSLEKEPLPGFPSYDCKGLYGSVCQEPNPVWRHSFRTSVATPFRGLDLALTWRFFDSVDVDTTSSNPQLSGNPTNADRTLSSRSYFDLSGAMTFLDQYTVRLGMNNILDKDPPLVGQVNCPSGPCNGNTYPTVYDALGRQIFVSLTADF